MGGLKTVNTGEVAYSTSNKENVVTGSFVLDVDISVIPREGADEVVSFAPGPEVATE